MNSKDVEKSEPYALDAVQSRAYGDVQDEGGHTHDAVFGDLSGDGPNYRNVCRSCHRENESRGANVQTFRSVGLEQWHS